MSQWTHVAGCIRYDSLRMVAMAHMSDLPKLLGNTVAFDSPREDWDKYNVPCGSEGSLQYYIWENPHPTSLAAYTVMIWGDLRDYENVQEIETWFRKILFGQMIRSAILEIDVEFKPTILLRWNDKKCDLDRFEIKENKQ